MKKQLFILSAFLTFSSVQAQGDSTKVNSQKGEPFDGVDQTWQNGSDRRDSSLFKKIKYFTPSILMDINYTYSFTDPIDNTVVGSTALARNNEMQLQALHFGGDFSYKGTRARFMTQFGMRSIVIPRNDYSPYRGQYQLANVYRYLSEAYAGITLINGMVLILILECLCHTSG
jgi:Putative beta-barrel porin-2, OmpL-like. bbp2